MTSRPYPVRWPALLCLSLVVGLLLAACQANTDVRLQTAAVTPGLSTPTIAKQPALTDTPAADPLPSITVQPTPDASFKGQTIEFWHPWQGDLAKRAEEAVNDFNKRNEWGLTVKVRAFYSGGALDEAIATGLKDKANGLPQVVAAPSEQLAAWSAQPGAIAGLDDFISRPLYGFTDEQIKAFYPVFWAQDQVGGKRIGIPALRTARVIFYNETWARELGFATPPITADDFKKQACAAAQKNNTSRVADKFGTGGWLIDNDALTTLSWLGAFGAQAIPDNEGKSYTFESKEAESAAAFLHGMVADGCAWVSRNPAPYEYFSGRMALFYSGTLPDVTVQAGWQKQLKNQDSWTILPFPGKDGKPVVYAGGYSYAVMQGKPEAGMAAWLFVRWMETPEVAVKLTEALNAIPVSSAVAAQFNDRQNSFPWNKILPLAEKARPAPALASWLDAHRVVEDAAWQIYRSSKEELPQILPQLDQVIKDMVGRSP